MAQKNKTGMRLRQTKSPRKKDAVWLIQMIAAMAASAAVTLTVAGLTGNAWAVMVAVSVWLCVICGVLRKVGRESWFYLGGLVVVLALTLAFRQQVLEGFRIFWNETGEAMVRGTGRVLPEWELRFDSKYGGVSFMLFSGVLAGVISLVCCALTSFAPVVLAAALPVMLLVGMTVFGADAGFVWLLPMLCVSVLLLHYSGWRKKASAAPVVASWAVCGVAACVLVAAMVLGGAQDWSAQIRENVHRRIHEVRYETEHTSLPDGDFTDYQPTEKKAEPALSVTMENPQQLYLRGFTGAVFTGDKWEALDTQTLAKNKEILYWLNLNAFDQSAQYDAAASYTRLEQSTVSVQNIGACSYYRYVPFCISGGMWSQPENLNTDGVRAEGARSYSYSVTAGGADEMMQVLTQLQTSDDPAVLQYRKAESAYRQFVGYYYLQVPDEVKELLQEQWDEIAGQYGSADNLTLQQAQECALMFLSQCFPEGSIPEDMCLPLEMAEGTGYQYATVAAMTLRYFGIPARYAEGYVISKVMAAGAESGKAITVDSSCARAWVEVYRDGIGWIPMELTPGIGEVMETPESKDPDKNSSNKGTTGKKDKEEKEEPQEDEQPEPTGGSRVQVVLKTLLRTVLSVLAALLLLMLLLWLRRKLLLGRKEKKFSGANMSDAVAWLYADSALLLEKLGFRRGNGSMRALKKTLEEKYGAEFAAQFEYASDLNDRAMFSEHMLDEDRRSAVREFRSHVVLKLKTETKWYKRMWLKWARCLY